jgi:arylsulfatase A-like enzyme
MKPMRLAAAAAATITALSVPGVASEDPPQGKAPSLVVLVSVDTLRADSVSFAGHWQITSAFMDELARDGVIFSNAYATSSWTPPSMGSLLTGLYPSCHGVTSGDIRDRGKIEQPVLSDIITTLAEVFSRAGYTTIGVPANRHLMADLGFAQGFDHYFEQAAFLPAQKLNSEVRKHLEEAYGSEWRTKLKETKTFLWIHYFDPHDPYFGRRPWIDRFAPDFKSKSAEYPNAIVMRELRKKFPRPDAELGSKIRHLYDSEVAYWDHHFGELARELGLDDPDVLLAFTSDHGEEMVEHGDIGHSQSLYEELVHVPMVVRWPAGIRGGRIETAQVSILDLFPTLVQLAGLELPEHLQGRSLAPLLRDGRNLENRPVFLQLMPPKPHLLAVRDGDWKLVVPQDGTGAPQLFDLTRDPGEHQNLAAGKPRIVRRLQRQLDRWFENLPPAPDLETAPLTDQQIEELRALGYVE